MATTNHDLRVLVIKRDLETALRQGGEEREILDSEERETLDKFYQDEETIDFIREIITNKELLLDTNEILRGVEMTVAKNYPQERTLLETIHGWNLQLIQRIESGTVSSHHLYEDPEIPLTSTQKM